MRAVLRQIGAIGAARILAALISALWLVLVARNVELDAFGDLALALTLVGALTAVADFGYPTVLAASMGRDPDSVRPMLATTVLRRLAIGVPCSVVLLLTYRSLADDRGIAVPLLFCVSLLASIVYTSMYTVLRGWGRAGPEAVNEVVSRLAVLGVGLVLLWDGGGIVAVAACYAAADSVSAGVLTLGVMMQLPTGGDRPDLSAFRLRRAGVVGMAGLISTLYYRLDTLMIGMLRKPSDVALYTAAYRFLDGMMLPAGAVAALVIPATAGLSDEAGNMRTRKFAGLVAGLTLPVAVAVGAMAVPLLERLYGPEYASAASTLRVLMISALPGALVLVVAPRVVIGHSSRTLAYVTVTFVANLVLNVWAIDAHGIVGAAVTTLVCQTLLFGLLCRHIRSERSWPQLT